MALIKPLTSFTFTNAIENGSVHPLGTSAFESHPGQNVNLSRSDLDGENLERALDHQRKHVRRMTNPLGMQPKRKSVPAMNVKGPLHIIQGEQFPLLTDYYPVQRGVENFISDIDLILKSDASSVTLLDLGLMLAKGFNNLTQAHWFVEMLMTDEGRNASLADERLRDMIFSRIRQFMESDRDVKLPEIYSMAADFKFFSTINKIDPKLTNFLAEIIFRALRNFLQSDKSVDDFLIALGVIDLLPPKENVAGQTTITNGTYLTMQVYQDQKERVEIFFNRLDDIVPRVIHRFLEFRESGAQIGYYVGDKLRIVPWYPFLKGLQYESFSEELPDGIDAEGDRRRRIYYQVPGSEDKTKYYLDEMHFADVRPVSVSYEAAQTPGMGGSDIESASIKAVTPVWQKVEQMLNFTLSLAASEPDAGEIKEKFVRRNGQFLKRERIADVLKEMVDQTVFEEHGTRHKTNASNNVHRSKFDNALRFEDFKVYVVQKLARKSVLQARRFNTEVMSEDLLKDEILSLENLWLAALKKIKGCELDSQAMLSDPDLKALIDQIFESFLGEVRNNPTLHLLFDKAGGYAQPYRQIRNVWDQRQYGLMDNVARALLMIGAQFTKAFADGFMSDKSEELLFSDTEARNHFLELLKIIQPQVTSALMLMQDASRDVSNRTTRPTKEMAALGAIENIENGYYEKLKKLGVEIDNPRMVAFAGEGTQFQQLDETTENHVVDTQFALYALLSHTVAERYWSQHAGTPNNQVLKEIFLSGFSKIKAFESLDKNATVKDFIEVYKQGDEFSGFMPAHLPDGSEIDMALFAEMMQQEIVNLFPKLVHWKEKIKVEGIYERIPSYTLQVSGALPARLGLTDATHSNQSIRVATFINPGEEVKLNSQVWVIGIGEQDFAAPIMMSYQELMAGIVGHSELKAIRRPVALRLVYAEVPLKQSEGDSNEESEEDKKRRLVLVLEYLMALDAKISRKRDASSGIWRENKCGELEQALYQRPSLLPIVS